MEAPTITPYVVSTITCNGSIGTAIDLGEYFTHARMVDATDEGIVCVEFGRGRTRGTEVRRHPAPKTTRGAAPSPARYVRNCFENQVTNIIHVRGAQDYMANVKLFRNGRVQATDLRSEADGRRILEVVAAEVRRIAAADCPGVVTDSGTVAAQEFRISMINCNFRVDFRVRRSALQDLLTGPAYGMRSFLGGTYPAVKLAYYWNEHNAPQGICGCGGEGVCRGKGRGAGPGDCKRVTVAVFESGSVLITGGNSFAQVDNAYAFIARVLRKHAGDVRKKDLVMDKELERLAIGT